MNRKARAKSPGLSSGSPLEAGLFRALPAPFPCSAGSFELPALMLAAMPV